MAGPPPATPAAASETLGSSAHRVDVPRGRALAILALIGVATTIGFLLGCQYERRVAEGPVLSTTGLDDYRALVTYNGYSIVRGNGPSMQPALARWNFLLVRDTRHIHRGDILISRHHGMHRVAGLPGETIWLVHGLVRVCTARPGTASACSMLTEPYVRYPNRDRNAGPVLVRGGYITVPDNRACCAALLFVPFDDVVGVEVGSLLSYGPLGPPGAAAPKRPQSPSLRYER